MLENYDSTKKFVIRNIRYVSYVHRKQPNLISLGKLEAIGFCKQIETITSAYLGKVILELMTQQQGEIEMLGGLSTI